MATVENYSVGFFSGSTAILATSKEVVSEAE